MRDRLKKFEDRIRPLFITAGITYIAFAALLEAIAFTAFDREALTSGAFVDSAARLFAFVAGSWFVHPACGAN